MYTVDQRDRVSVDADLPAPEAGAPEPAVLASEVRAIVAYYAPDKIAWNTARPEDLREEEVVVLVFDSVRSLIFGSPNDEALHGHPLSDRGLEAYAAHWVENSSWIRGHERMNSVHPMHNAERFEGMRHFILTFHDSMFECICCARPSVVIVRGSTPLKAAIQHS